MKKEEQNEQDDDNGDYELVPITPIMKLKKEVDALKRERQIDLPMDEINRNMERLSEQLSKLVSININLQAKMTELMIKTTDLIEGVSEMVDLLRRASEVEVEGGQVVQLPPEALSPVVEELKKMSRTNKEVTDAMKDLEKYIRKEYTRGLIRGALGQRQQQAQQRPPAPTE